MENTKKGKCSHSSLIPKANQVHNLSVPIKSNSVLLNVSELLHLLSTHLR